MNLFSEILQVGKIFEIDIVLFHFTFWGHLIFLKSLFLEVAFIFEAIFIFEVIFIFGVIFILNVVIDLEVLLYSGLQYQKTGENFTLNLFMLSDPIYL